MKIKMPSQRAALHPLTALLILGLSLGLLLRAGAQPVDPDFPIQFSSASSTFPVQGGFDGLCRVEDGRIALRLSEANIFTGQHVADGKSMVVAEVTFGLATTLKSGAWKIVRRGTRVRGYKIFTRGTIMKMGPMEASIPAAGLDLSRHWIVVTIGMIGPASRPDQRPQAFCYAHSSRAVFTRFSPPANARPKPPQEAQQEEAREEEARKRDAERAETEITTIIFPDQAATDAAPQPARSPNTPRAGEARRGGARPTARTARDGGTQGGTEGGAGAQDAPEGKAEARGDDAPPRVLPLALDSQVGARASAKNVEILRGDFEGEARVGRRAIEVAFSSARLRLTNNRNEAHALISRVTPCLATSQDGEWKIVQRGEPIPVGRTLGVGEVCRLDEAHASIALPQNIDLSRHWLVLQVEFKSLVGLPENQRGASLFVHSNPNFFALPTPVDAPLPAVDEAK